MTTILRRLRGLVTREKLDRQLDAEIRFHLEMEAQKHVRRGMTPEAARHQSLKDFGPMTRHVEETREARTVARLEETLQDVRYGFRTLLKSPGFAAVAILTLALGLGANTAIFSVINAVLLRPLPYENGDRLVLIRQSAPLVDQQDVGVSIKELYDYREQLASFDGLVEFHQMTFDLLRRGEPDRVATGVVSPNFFDVLGITPLVGRTFVNADDQRAAEPVLVLGHAYWLTKFGGDPDIVGQVFEMNDRPHTVVGVLPAVPLYPNEVDVYMPTSACPFRAGAEGQIAQNRRAFPMLQVFGLLDRDAAPERAATEVSTVGARFGQAFPNVYRPQTGFQARTVGVQEELTRNARPMLLILLGTTGLVLLIACANVANLTLARMVRRDRELAMRAALGAGRWRLVRQLLTESTLVAVIGGAAGLVFAWLTVDLLATFVARFTPRAGGIGIDTRVLLFTLGASMITGLLFGILPAFKTRVDVSGALKTGGKGGSEPPGHRRLRDALVVAQVAVSVVLLVGAGLLLVSFYRLQRVDPGYRAEGVMSAEIFGNFSKYSSAASLRRLYGEVLDRLEATPGVSSAAVTNAVPLAGLQPGQTRFQIDGIVADNPDLAPTTDVRIASPAYFATLGIPLLRGRVFNALDHEQAERVVVINEAVTQYWNGREPIGTRVSADGGQTWYTVVGIVGNVRQFGLDREAVAQHYVPLAQAPGGLAGRVLVRANGDPASAVAAIRAAVHGVDPDMPIENVQTLDEIRAAYLAAPRLTALLLSIFAALALVVTITGITGVIATSVSHRTQEFGVRMALGASSKRVVAMVLRQGLTLVAVGLALGIGSALVLGRVLQSYLYATTPTDPIALVAVATAFTAAGALACLGPAWRATTVDPARALRTD
jgi:predicted permease